MTALCPNGHSSADPDWCDTCGARIGASTLPTTSAPGPTSATSAGLHSTVACPHCGTANAPSNLFCEDCGYDFTTGQTPPTPATGSVSAGGPGPAAGSAGGSPTSSSTSTVQIQAVTDPAAPAIAGWTAIVEIDPAWFEAKGRDAGTVCPPFSSSTIPLTASPALIGRTSQSKGIHPAIPLDQDPAVSRRHAQLVYDGTVWSVIDLDSSNGSYVLSGDAVPSAELPPLASGVSTALPDGTRLYVGAWTKITVRAV
jgi:hypothetical protein